MGLREPWERRRHRKAVLARMAEVREAHADPEVAARREELRAMREADDARRAEWCRRHGRTDAHSLPPVEVTPEELLVGAGLYLDMGRVARRVRRRAKRVRRRRAGRLARVVRWRLTRARDACERSAVTEAVAARGRWPPSTPAIPSLGVQHRVEEAGEAAVEVGSAEAVEDVAAALFGLDDAGGAQDLVVVAAGGFGEFGAGHAGAAVEAGRVLAGGEAADGVEAHGVREGAEDRGEVEVRDVRVVETHRGKMGLACKLFNRVELSGKGS